MNKQPATELSKLSSAGNCEKRTHDYHDVFFFLNVSEQLASQFKDWLMTVDGGLKSDASASESRQQLFFHIGLPDLR